MIDSIELFRTFKEKIRCSIVFENRYRNDVHTWKVGYEYSYDYWFEHWTNIVKKYNSSFFFSHFTIIRWAIVALRFGLRLRLRLSARNRGYKLTLLIFKYFLMKGPRELLLLMIDLIWFDLIWFDLIWFDWEMIVHYDSTVLWVLVRVTNTSKTTR